jgi:hypothetical protein
MKPEPGVCSYRASAHGVIPRISSVPTSPPHLSPSPSSAQHGIHFLGLLGFPFLSVTNRSPFRPALEKVFNDPSPERGSEVLPLLGEEKRREEKRREEKRRRRFTQKRT